MAVRADGIVSGLAMIVLGGSVLSAILIVGQQVFDWLKTGVWTPATIGELLSRMGFSAPGTEWIGLQRVIDWIMAGPASVGIFVSGFAVFMLLGVCADHLHWERLKRDNAKNSPYE